MSRPALLFLTASILVGSGAANAQVLNLNQPNVNTAPDPRTLPNLIFERVEHNFGTIFDDQRVETRLVFWNEGPGTLEIREWRGSCSCTVGELHREGEDPSNPAGARRPDGLLPTVIFQPGERGWLDVTYDPHNKSGMQTQTVTFITNDVRSPTKVFRIAVNVLPLVAVEPQVINFNQVVKGQSATLDVFVTGRTEDFRVEAASASGFEFISVDIHETIDMVKDADGMWVPAETEDADHAALESGAEASTATRKAPEAVQPEAEHVGHDHDQPVMHAIAPETEGAEILRRTRLTVTLSADAPPGRINGSLSIRHNDPRREAVSAIIMGEVVGDVAVLPRQLAIGLQVAEVPWERKIQVLSRSGVGFRIERVEQLSNLPDTHKLNIQWEPIAGGANQGYIITIRGRAPASLAQMQGEFRIHTSLSSEPVITVPFFGHVQGTR